LNPGSIDTTERAPLAHDYRIEDLAAGLWSPAANCNANHIANATGRVSASYTALLEDGNQLHDLSASIVDAVHLRHAG
jgi:hypothetical protein